MLVTSGSSSNQGILRSQATDSRMANAAGLPVQARPGQIATTAGGFAAAAAGFSSTGQGTGRLEQVCVGGWGMLFLVGVSVHHS